MHTTFVVLAVIAIACQGLVLFLAFFGPDLSYRIENIPDEDIASEPFLSLIAVLTDAQVHKKTAIEVLTNGGCFYEAELLAIRTPPARSTSKHTFFSAGEIADRFVEALAERARAGVKVQAHYRLHRQLQHFQKLFPRR